MSVLRQTHQTHQTGRAPQAGRERGQATLEMVGLIPVFCVVLVVVVQVMALAYTAHAASQAARDGARAYSLDQSPVGAAQASLPGSVHLVAVNTYGPDHGVTVTVQSPPVLLLTRTVTRSVVMP
ncbi:TadE/TadG family type IV pilus assembly protein [uncultured Friedmanniella sp.]|uniref:TadE/TadG family type IV pilus assembly protein n=1 Tax=uncultured Friedmanniella sp. TaxID=335381 RepID=UPI0035C9E177